MNSHGTRGRYNAGCRCAECRGVNTAAHQRWKIGAATRQPPAHGTHSGYTNYSCRCAACKRANSETCKEQYHRRKLRAAGGVA